MFSWCEWGIKLLFLVTLYVLLPLQDHCAVQMES